MQLGAQLVGFGQCHGGSTFFGAVRPPDVKADIHRIGFHPDRVAQVQRHEHQLAAKNRGQVQAVGNVLCYRLVKAAFEPGGQLAQVKRAHMHGHFRRFKV